MLEESQRSAKVGSSEWDIPGDVITWSDELYRIYGLEPQSVPMTYERYLGLLHPDDREMVDRIVELAYQDGQPFAFDHRIVRPDGTVRVLHRRGRVVMDAGGKAVSMVGSGQDITERRALEQMQQDFIAMVGHELRSPLTSIKGYAQLLRRRQAYDEAWVDAVIRQSDKLERLVGDLLDASRAQSGQLQLRPEPSELVALVRVGVREAAGRSERHTLRLEAAAGPLRGRWDPHRLSQIFQNLLSNAIKYSPEGGEVLVRIEDLGPEARVSVRDHGQGIEPEALPHLFTRFYRGGSATGGVPGLGLGLYISKELVEAHGGRIWAESAGQGRGSTFCFTLPLDRVGLQA